MKVVHKKYIVDAMQYDGKNIKEVMEFVSGIAEVIIHPKSDGCMFVDRATENVFGAYQFGTAFPGDYILKSGKGEDGNVGVVTEEMFVTLFVPVK